MDINDDHKPKQPRKRYLRNKRPCASCTTRLVASGVLFCRPCYLDRHKAKPVPINLCPDCSRPINIRAYHCRKCYTKHRLVHHRRIVERQPPQS